MKRFVPFSTWSLEGLGNSGDPGKPVFVENTLSIDANATQRLCPGVV
jgi:hypothetical protein